MRKFSDQQKQSTEVFCTKNAFLKISQISLGNNWEYFFNKVAGLQACDFIKKRHQHRRFPMKFAKFLRTPILNNICERLFLDQLSCKHVRTDASQSSSYIAIKHRIVFICQFWTQFLALIQDIFLNAREIALKIHKKRISYWLIRYCF